MALTERIHDNASSFPASWFEPSVPSDEDEQERLHKLATVILKRRIADYFRKQKRLPPFDPVEEIEDELPDPHSEASDKTLLLSKMLRVTLKVLDEMSPEDRDLIALVSSKIGLRQGLDAADRQRLHRIRTKLKSEITRTLGAEAADLLRFA